MKLALFGLAGIKTGKHNLKDPRLDEADKLVEADKKTHAQVDVVGEDQLIDADAILVLDGGQISALGRHDDLLKNSQLYRRMCARLSVGKSLDEPETVDELIQAARP